MEDTKNKSYQEEWEETLQGKTKDELLDIMRKQKDYEAAFIDIVRAKLVNEHCVAEGEIERSVNEMIDEKRAKAGNIDYSKPLSEKSKMIFVIVEAFMFVLVFSRIVFDGITFLVAIILTVFAKVMRDKLVTDELGDKVYYYNEQSRKWLKRWPGMSIAVWAGALLCRVINYWLL